MRVAKEQRVNPNLGVGGIFTLTPPPPCYWFSLDSSETVKAVNLVFCIIK